MISSHMHIPATKWHHVGAGERVRLSAFSWLGIGSLVVDRELGLDRKCRLELWGKGSCIGKGMIEANRKRLDWGAVLIGDYRIAWSDGDDGIMYTPVRIRAGIESKVYLR